MIDCSKCIHNEVCANKVANDGLDGECGFFKAEQPKGDLISRSALKKYARVVFDKDLGRLIVVDVSDIDNAPTVDIKTEVSKELAKEAREIADENYKYGYEKGKAEAIPKGEWILNKDENPECPYCHQSFTYWGNFCGNCGADMR